MQREKVVKSEMPSPMGRSQVLSGVCNVAIGVVRAQYIYSHPRKFLQNHPMSFYFYFVPIWMSYHPVKSGKERERQKV